MPLYEYECSNCHHRYEKIEPFSAPKTQKCPHCGKKADRLLAAPAIQFKGSGWYVTDYARKGSAPSPAQSSTAEKAGDGSGVSSGSTDKPVSTTATEKSAKKE